MEPISTGPQEIRPASPDGILFAGVPGGLRMVADRERILVDPQAGTIAWTGHVKSRGTTLMRLPDRTEPAELPELHTVCIATVFGPVTARCLVFADRQNRTIANSGRIDYRNFEKLWKVGLLEQLTRYGVLVTRETFVGAHQFNKTYRGASRYWYLLTPPWNIAVLLIPCIIAVAILFFLAGFGVIH